MSELKYQKFLDTEFFRKILAANHKNSSVKVHEVHVEPCGAANDGFLSTLLRTRVEFLVNSKVETETYVVKLMTHQELAVEKFGANGYNVQDKEMMFFEVLAPQVQKVLKKIGEDENLFPRVAAINHEHDAIVFQDLKEYNFVMADRMIGLDEAHIHLSLEKLAKFHAASLMIHQKCPTVFNFFDSGILSRKVDAFNGAFTSIFEYAVDEIKTWSGFELYAEKLESLKEFLIENARRCFDYDDNEFCVLNHGDVWTNNLMFKYNANEQVEEAILIDFQFCHWGSPALDLIHLLYTSLNDELYTQAQVERFVQVHYYQLKSTLQKLEYNFVNFPSLQQFQIEMFRKSFYALVYNMTVYPIMTSDDVDNDFIAHHSNDERASNFKKRIMKSEKFQRVVKRMLPVFDQMGLLDMHEQSDR